MYNGILNRLLSYPQIGQIKVDLNFKTKIFRLSVPIFSSKNLPSKIKEYVIARKGLNFKPHATSYQLHGEDVYLVQEIPFCYDFQASSRGDVEHFLQMSRYCHKMLAEIVIEDTYKNALRI